MLSGLLSVGRRPRAQNAPPPPAPPAPSTVTSIATLANQPENPDAIRELITNVRNDKYPSLEVDDGQGIGTPLIKMVHAIAKHDAGKLAGIDPTLLAEAATALLEKGANIQGQESNFLLYGSYYPTLREKFVYVLLGKQTFDQTFQDDNGNTAIMFAAQNNDVKLVEALLQQPQGMVALALTTKKGLTALIKCLVKDAVATAELISNYRTCNPGAVDEYGQTALMIAAHRPAMVKVANNLLDYFDVNASQVSNAGNTAARYAASVGQMELAQKIAARAELELKISGSGQFKSSAGCEGMDDVVTYESIDEGNGVYIDQQCYNREDLRRWFANGHYTAPHNQQLVHPEDIKAYGLQVPGVPLPQVQPNKAYARASEWVRSTPGCNGRQDFIHRDQTIGPDEGVNIEGVCYQKDGLKQFIRSSKLYKTPHNNKPLNPADVRAFGLQVSEVPVPAAAPGASYAQFNADWTGGRRRRARGHKTRHRGNHNRNNDTTKTKNGDRKKYVRYTARRRQQ